jgi:hypothetical protein
MAKQGIAIADLQQLVQQSAVAEIDLWGLHLAFEQVGVPGLQQPHHEHTLQQVEIAAAGGLVDPEGTAQFGAVPWLPMTMGQHRPEALQGHGRHALAQLRQVALQQCADEVAPPDQTVGLVVGQKRTWKTAPQPQRIGGLQA